MIIEHAPTSAERWALFNGALPIGKSVMRVGCKHRRGVSACGGCHARLYEALKEIEQRPETAAAVVAAVFAAMRAENKR